MPDSLFDPDALRNVFPAALPDSMVDPSIAAYEGLTNALTAEQEARGRLEVTGGRQDAIGGLLDEEDGLGLPPVDDAKDPLLNNGDGLDLPSPDDPEPTLSIEEGIRQAEDVVRNAFDTQSGREKAREILKHAPRSPEVDAFYDQTIVEQAEDVVRNAFDTQSGRQVARNFLEKAVPRTPEAKAKLDAFYDQTIVEQAEDVVRNAFDTQSGRQVARNFLEKAVPRTPEGRLKIDQLLASLQ
jgi:hypothetical protein